MGNRTKIFLWGPLFIIILLSGCASFPVLSTDDRIWSRYESPHFTLITDIKDDRATIFLEELEDFRSFARTILNPISGDRPRLTIIAPSTQEGFSAFANPRAYGGVYFRTIDTDFMVINLAVADLPEGRFNGDFTAQDFLQHEYLHAVIADLPGKPVPLWYNEGMAEYLATARRDGDYYTIGTPLKNRIRDLSSARRTSSLRTGDQVISRRIIVDQQPLELAPLETILKASTISDVYRNAQDLTNYHAQAWLLTHYLYSDPECQEKLSTYFEMRASREDDIAALERTYGQTVKQLDDAIWATLRNDNFPIFRMLAPAPTSTTIRKEGPLTEAELWCNVGRFKGFFAGATTAKQAFRHALELDEKNVCALTHLSKLESWDFNLDTAEKLTQKAETLDPNDPFTPLSRSMIYYNFIRRALENQKTADIRAYEEGIKWAKKTIELEPTITLSYIVQAALLRTKPGATQAELEEALESAQTAEKLAPQNISIPFLTANIYRDLGRFDEARSRYEYTYAWSKQDNLRKVSKFYLEQDDMKKSENDNILNKDDLK